MNYQHPNGTFGARIVHKSQWTDEIDARVKVLIDEKYSSAEIASALNRQFKTSFSRNAILGRIHRCKLGQLYARPRDSNTPKVKPRRESQKRIRVAPSPIPINPTPIETDINDFSIPIEQRCTLQQLTATTCRFPVGDPCTEDFFFCGGTTVPDKPYCAFHCLRAYNYEATNKRFRKVLSREAAPSVSPDSVNYPLRKTG